MMQTILITGASSGLGAALAQAYAAPDVRLLLVARRATRLSEVAAVCRSKGAEVVAAVLDVTDTKAMMEWILATDAQTPIDIVYANAGVSGGSLGIDISDTSEQDHYIFDINVKGVFNTIHPVMGGMVRRGHGQIVLISSLAGFLSAPGAPAYAASKAAVRMYGEAITPKLRPLGIDVTVICPGFVVSEMTAANHFRMPFLMPTDKAVALIMQAVANKKSRYCFPFAAKMSVYALRLLPLFVQNRIFMRLPAKKSLPDTQKRANLATEDCHHDNYN